MTVVTRVLTVSLEEYSGQDDEGMVQGVAEASRTKKEENEEFD